MLWDIQLDFNPKAELNPVNTKSIAKSLQYRPMHQQIVGTDRELDYRISTHVDCTATKNPSHVIHQNKSTRKKNRVTTREDRNES